MTQHKDITPPPLSIAINRTIRFEEIDITGVLWHGHYISLFEEARVAFGDTYGLSYKNFIKYKTIAPVVKLAIEYKTPLRFQDNITIIATLHWSESLKFNFSYWILKDKKIATIANSTQVLTDIKGNLLFIPPRWIKDFLEKWKTGKIQSQYTLPTIIS